MHRIIVGLLSLLPALVIAWDVCAQESMRWRLHVRDGEVYRGSSSFRIWSIDQSHLYRPGVPEVEMIETFIKVSDAGATSMTFDLHGFNEDGTELDDESVKAVRRVMAAGDYRWMPSICRILGAYPDATPEFRRGAVRTTAETFKDNFTMLFWIDGPDSERLAAEFREIAPMLTVLAPAGGDIKLIHALGEHETGVPTLIANAIPERDNWDLHCYVPGTEQNFDVMERMARLPVESEPWKPTDHGLTQEEKEAGFVSLFDGESLAGWGITGRKQDGFIVDDGAIQWNGRGGRTLQSRNRYGDFILRLQWKIHRKNGNSGIFLRAPRANRASKMGFEFQIYGDHGEPPDEHSTGAIYDVMAPMVNASRPVGEWNDLEILLNGPHYRATLNGKVVQDVDFDEHADLRHRLRRGFIALQDHSNPVSFRNIRIRELNVITNRKTSSNQ